ncbi:hypothetical protein AB6A40_003915 [Gnathostoma spinigerum]|uniref:Invertebrate defensins family profile domain-containing protein n=1 Tax=Gnathostoma spinigerum TaxID=75299 RepID=A0ABD6EDC6_9BILA
MIFVKLHIVIFTTLILMVIHQTTSNNGQALAMPSRYRYGCTALDHQECDELCKQDSYWYGHCSSWDGRDFSCRCFDYKPPLRRSVCINRQEACEDECRSKGYEGGYCYVKKALDVPEGVHVCQCFEDLRIDRR